MSLGRKCGQFKGFLKLLLVVMGCMLCTFIVKHFNPSMGVKCHLNKHKPLTDIIWVVFKCRESAERKAKRKPKPP